jgi:heavy metal efflux system protein
VLKSILAFGLTRRAIILLGLLVFIGGGLIAFAKLNIEAYPNPAPVILEITAQAPGLSAEEMERYYTIPMEIGLYPTPGVDNIRSTSFYGLSFVRVTFKYGIDYFASSGKRVGGFGPFLNRCLLLLLRCGHVATRLRCPPCP